jgi:hypothetical protein
MTRTRKPLFKDAYSRIYEDAQGVMHVQIAGQVLTPQPSLYPDFTSRDFGVLYQELTSSGIPEPVAARWVNQAQGFDGV